MDKKRVTRRGLCIEGYANDPVDLISNYLIKIGRFLNTYLIFISVIFNVSFTANFALSDELNSSDHVKNESYTVNSELGRCIFEILQDDSSEFRCDQNYLKLSRASNSELILSNPFYGQWSDIRYVVMQDISNDISKKYIDNLKIISENCRKTTCDEVPREYIELINSIILGYKPKWGGEIMFPNRLMARSTGRKLYIFEGSSGDLAIMIHADNKNFPMYSRAEISFAPLGDE